MSEEVRALKNALKMKNTRKSTSRRILTGILSKTCELKPKFIPLTAWSSQYDKQVKQSWL